MLRTPRSRRPLLLLAIVAGILYATMSPFDFRFDNPNALGKIEWYPLPTPDHESLFVDFALNILFFLPFGAAGYLWRRATSTIPSSILLAALGGLSLSLIAETAQLWLPTRHTQTMDVLANTIGALAGAAFAAAGEKTLDLRSLGKNVSGAGWNLAAAAALAFLALPFATAVYTLDPVRSVPELREHARMFVRSPIFGGRSFENTAFPLLILGGMAFSLAEWIMGCFPSFRVPFTYLLVLMVGALYAVLLPIPRIFFRPFSPDWGSIGFGVLGVVLGILAHFRIRYRALRGR